MKKFTITLIFAALFVASPLIKAQVALGDFSNFGASALFYGAWSSTGDTVIGSSSSAAGLAQNGSAFTFAGVTNEDTAYVEYSFASAINIGSLDALSLSLKQLPGNTAGQLSVTLYNDSGESASSTFNLADYNSTSFSTQTSLLNPSASFDASAVTLFRLSGGVASGSDTLSVSISGLSAVSAVPEPATYGLISGVAILGLASLRKLRRRSVTTTV